MTGGGKPFLAMVGLGRMGANMVRRLGRAGIRCAAYDQSVEARAALQTADSALLATSLPAAVAALAAPRIVWLMLPSGDITESTLHELLPLLSAGDIVIDGGNADYRDSMRRAALLQARGLHLIDVGVSGGVWGLEKGYGLMYGGSRAAVAALQPALNALAPAPGIGMVHCGDAGSGHYAKMVHNGIEYGMMQAFAEGFALLKAKSEFQLDVAAIAEAWRHGTVVRSWLLDLAAGALRDPVAIDETAPVVADSGEGRWTVRESIDLRIPTPVITAALQARFASQGKADYSARILAQLRKAFGGHGIETVSRT
jgi:6-phosphogluconate dehydrogenase